MADTEYATRDYAVVRGDSWSDDIIVTGANGDPLDLTDAEPEFSIEWRGGRLDLVEDEGIVFVPLEGRISPSLTPEQTQELPLGKLAKFQLRLTESDGARRTRMLGFFVGTDAVIEDA